jgi:21S rRNA (GM2251-2'-O)-methyltransferase
MLRSAYCLGASGVLACSRNCAPLSPVVSKASAGAAELMRLCSCRSMPRTLADAAEKGWAVVGAAAEPGAVPVSELRALDRPTLLVMGNEGAGLRATVRRCCTAMVRIDMAAGAPSSSRRGVSGGGGGNGGVQGDDVGDGDDAAAAVEVEDGEEEGAGGSLGGRAGGGGGGPLLVDSLNVSVATGILLHALLTRQQQQQQQQ